MVCQIELTRYEKNELIIRLEYFSKRIAGLTERHPKMREETLVDNLLLFLENDDKNVSKEVQSRIRFMALTTSKYKEAVMGFDFGILIDKYDDNGKLLCSKLDIIQAKKHSNNFFNLDETALKEAKNMIKLLNHENENILPKYGEFMFIGDDRIAIIPVNVIIDFIEEQELGKHSFNEIISFSRKKNRGYSLFSNFIANKIFRCKRGLQGYPYNSYYQNDDSNLISRNFENNVNLEINRGKNRAKITSKNEIIFTTDIFDINQILHIIIKGSPMNDDY